MSNKASSILLSPTSKSFKLFASSLDKALFNELVELVYSPQAIVRHNASDIIEALAEGKGLDEEGDGEGKRDGGYGGRPCKGYEGRVMHEDAKEKRNENNKEANNEPTVTKEELLRRLLSWGVVLNLVGVLALPTATDIAKIGAAGALLNLYAPVGKKRNKRRYGGGG
ncbi:uncharacterized protein MONOS_14397 [Monocercomonoides exilis]|uniref:uncharacterized protein n=1 Tax=Monocercomonoides exilis TaxID=2049356 RepID=UPI003559A88E|nr:hypothetical protein MONOS_14397 [Monocercomonoides exilis]|eukprot:MONOS_14397.1-p1 / transcript=MONOS_14397.1 / gene=MONOS_14397 / organism=Monocercomonoides_exilis_PA203 / gene_product=unspecified product / transcript_product=unspecified product / location=Mono_scaffold00995:3051-3851(-) / protein_length=168 / sequence_SO=supercontig / SO=protein_coding / is_pseudo=false